DADLSVLQRLTQRLQRVAPKLGQLVEKEDPAVGQRGLSRRGRIRRADESRVADRVVRRPKGWPPENAASPEPPRRAPDRGGLQRLLEAQVRQKRGKASRQHGLAGPRRPDEEEVVAARRGDLQRLARLRLPPHVGQVGLGAVVPGLDRKSTRLNSSHVKISYA